MLPPVAALSISLSLLAGPAAAVVDGTVASADGVAVHYHVEGRGEPALVFVHGWCGDGGVWSNQIKEFAPHHRVVTVDLAGHGSSGANRKQWTIAAFGADVASVVGKLGLKRAVLVGHSMGGPVIVEATLRIPDQVGLLVPVDTLQNAEFRMSPEEIAAFLAPFEKDFPTAAGQFMRRFFPATASPDMVDRIVSKASSASPSMAIAALREVFSYDLTRPLPRIKQPIRAINSDGWPTMTEVNRKYAPRFEVTVMKGVGHFPMLMAPREFNRLLAEAMEDPR